MVSTIQLRYKKELEDERNNNINNPTCLSITFLEQNGYLLDKDTNLPKIPQKNTQYYFRNKFSINDTYLLNTLKNDEKYCMYQESPIAVVIEYNNYEKEILFNYFNIKLLGEKLKTYVFRDSIINNYLEYTLNCLSKGIKSIYFYYFTFIAKSPVKVTKLFYNKETNYIEAEYYSDFDKDDFLQFPSGIKKFQKKSTSTETRITDSYYSCIIS